ncbi:drebrin [Lampris incognitus]|uniref:drebrin n=1 Tax=Lampris incognitus TaxID=2546036 RepID=UPI0024B5E198|nr:drebrin [Lampris incognitus]
MAVNLGKNRLVLLTAYQDVIDDTSDTDWALYTYEEDNNDLMLASSGGGGLPEITVTFDNSMVMYGFCSLKEPSSALPRYVLINWVGEDVPDARKCACASHVATIADFFQGVDIIINASTMDDIDPAAIGQRLTNGTAVVASPVLSRLKTREEELTEQVGTVYHKTNAEVEMKTINREEFWEQAKREEEIRKEQEKKKAAEERQRFEEERMVLERKEQEDREKRYRERERQIEEHRKKMQEEEEAKERSRSRPAVVAEPSYEDLNQDKKETEVEEAKAIIAQRSGNPRDFFKQKERALSSSVDAAPVSVHRTGDDDDAEASTEHSMAAVSPIPKIITTPIKEEASREDESSRTEWDSVPQQEQPPVQEAAHSKPVQPVAPQTRDPSDFSVWESGTDSLVDLWDAGSNAPSASSQSSHLVDLMSDSADVLPPASAGGSSTVRPQPLLSFDEMIDSSLCSAGAEDDPSSLVDVAGSDQMTLSYQHALQHASGEGKEQELDDGQLLMTNGETLLKEGTQASEGYFSQSQEEEFGQSEDGSAKPTPVFYNKPPEIDITCWDTDPVVDEDDED